MNPRMLRVGALIAILFPGGASAVGFGDIVLHSRIGEPLLAEVPILAGNGEALDAACFSLAQIGGSDLPVVVNARFRLARNGPTARLTITGTQPVAEPIFVIGLRAHCGIDLQRDYVLMPSPPMMLAETASDAARVSTPAATPIGKSRNYREWSARRGDTLESIADAQTADNPAEQQRLLTAIKRANPDLGADEALAEGTTVRIPTLARRPASRPAASADAPAKPRPQLAEAPAPRPKKAVAPAVPAATAGGPDRIVLGAAPDDLRPEAKPARGPSSAGEVEERMLKLESTLNQLNQEVEKLNTALALATEALAIQQKLMTAQIQQSPPAAAPALSAAAPTPAAPEQSSRGNWLELLFSALIGGGVAAGLAHVLSRRSELQNEEELPLSIAGHQHAIAPRPATAGTVPADTARPDRPRTAAAAMPTTDVDIQLDDNPTNLANQAMVNVDFNDGNSALELAEIMLSFGRIKGAAETLAMHIEEQAPNNIQPWSMLLDLYRRSDMHSEFEALAEQMRHKFNIRIPAWADSVTPVSGLKSLEDYAHIVWRINNSWGEQECMEYLYELVLDNRSGNRGGFPLEVVEEIALLMRVLEEGYGLRRPN